MGWQWLRGRLKPIGLLIAGLYLLVGCIPLPSTQQYLVNGKAKPSYLIGRGTKDPIRLGVTPIEEALTLVCERVAGVQVAGANKAIMSFNPVVVTPEDVRQQVVRINNGRRYVIPYMRRSGYLVWPICFETWIEGEQDYIALDVNENGIVTGYQTDHNPAKLGYDVDTGIPFYYRKPTSTRPTTENLR